MPLGLHCHCNVSTPPCRPRLLGKERKTRATTANAGWEYMVAEGSNPTLPAPKGQAVQQLSPILSPSVMGSVAQLVRARGCDPRRCGFKSHLTPLKNCGECRRNYMARKDAGSTPARRGESRRWCNGSTSCRGNPSCFSIPRRHIRGCVGTGRRSRLRSAWADARVGSNPTGRMV